MAIEARMVHGHALLMLDYTPTAAVLGGAVVLIGNRPLITHRDIAANKLGALAAKGGVYEAKAEGAMGTVVDGGPRVFWNFTTKRLSLSGGANNQIGYLVPGQVAVNNGDFVCFEHVPGGEADTLNQISTVAAFGTIQGDAAPVFDGFNLVTGADAAKGVILPAAVAGRRVEIKNSDAANAVLKVWPAVGDGINAIAVNSALSMAAKTSAVFVAIDATTWITIPLVPS